MLKNFLKANKHLFRISMAILLPLFFAALLIIKSHHDYVTQKEKAKESFFLLTEGLSQAISKLFYANYHNVQALSKNPVLRTLDPTKVKFVLNEFKTMFPNVDYIMMLDAKGNFVASSNLNNKFKELNPISSELLAKTTEYKWVKDLQEDIFTDDKEKSIFYSYFDKIGRDPIANELYGEPRVGNFVATVVEDDFSNRVGYVAMFLNIRWAMTEIENLYEALKKSGRQGFSVAIVDDQNRIISAAPASSYPPPVSTAIKMDSHNVTDDLLAGKVGTLIDNGIENKDKMSLFAFQPIKNAMFLDKVTGWRVLVEADMDTEFREITDSFNQFVLIVMIAAVMCILLLLKNIQFVIKLEKFNMQLESLVQQRTEQLMVKSNDIKMMLQNINQGIFTISEDGEIHQEYSAYLEQILGTKEISGKNLDDLIFSHSEISSDQRNQVSESIKAIVGASDLSYDLNSDKLVKKLNFLRNSSDNRSLEIDWIPIHSQTEKENIAKILVTLRDVSELKQLQIEAKKQQVRMEMITQILDVPDDIFANLIANCERLLKACHTLIVENSVPKKEVIEALFINMHTIKGNSRGRGFTFLADRAHNAEHLYDEIRKGHTEMWNKEALLTDLEKVESCYNRYVKINRDVLKRDGTQANNFNPAEVEKLVNYAIDAVEKNSKIEAKDSILKIKNSLLGTDAVKKLILGAKAHLSNEIKNGELKIELPNLHFDFSRIDLSLETRSVLEQIFSHLINNSLAHGIETKEERIKAGKDPVGNIFFTAKKSDSGPIITYSDDGKGLNLRKIAEKAKKSGIAVEGLTEEEVANLIFAAGISTAETLTQNAGRGVGMGAVKALLEEVGAKVHLDLKEAPSEQGFRSFELRIQLRPTIKVASV